MREVMAKDMHKVKKSGTRKSREGVVVSNKMQKTVTVLVTTRERHPTFEKVVLRGKKFYAHSEGFDLQVGQHVRIMETRPLSKLKRWRVTELLQK